MSYISNYIDTINKQNRKALSIFLTAGFPKKDGFVDLAKKVIDAGADLFELGMPFSDPLADGPTIQAASKIALDNGITMKDIFEYTNAISTYTNKPIILMGYANPIRKYGVDNFLRDASNAGAKGLIVPDVPLEEHSSFFHSEGRRSLQEESPTMMSDGILSAKKGQVILHFVQNKIDIILLTTPTSTEERIKQIDEVSEGFVYCVSITGITGTRDKFSEEILNNIKRTRSIITKNKMLIGFGISKPEHVRQFVPYCDGVIVASAVIKSILNNEPEEKTLQIIKELSAACKV